MTDQNPLPTHEPRKASGRGLVASGLFAGALLVASFFMDSGDGQVAAPLLSSTALRTALSSTPTPDGPLADELSFYQTRLEVRDGDDPLADRRLLGLSQDRFRAFGAAADIERAERIADRLQARYPTDGGLWEARVGLALARHDFPGARAAADSALRYSGADGRSAQLTQFDALLASGQYDQALEIVHPSSPASTFAELVRRARIRDRTGDLPGATEDMTRVLELVRAQAEAPTVEAWALVELAHFHHHGGNPARAIELNLEALTLVPGYAPALEGLGWIAWAVDRNPHTAEALFNRAVDHGGHADLLTVLMEIAESRGDPAAAAEHRARFLQIAQRDDLSVQLYRRPLALTLAEMPGMRTRALELAQQDRAARPDQGSIAVLAWISALAGNHEAAVDLARQAVDWGSPEPTTIHLAGKAAVSAGATEFGRSLLEEALDAESEIGPAATADIRNRLGGTQ